MNRRHLIGALSVAIGSLTAGCISKLSDDLSGSSTADVKENAETVEYDDLYRNISDYDGEPITYSGVEITDIADSQDGYQEYILQHPASTASEGKYLYGNWSGDPFKRDDVVELWGTVEGTTTYTALAGEQTVPEIEIVDMVLESE